MSITKYLRLPKWHYIA